MADNINSGKKKKDRGGAGTSGKAKKRIVEKILGKRNANGHTELLLKWKDLPEEESTWEPQSMLGPENIHMLTQFNYQYQRIPPKAANQNPQAAKAKANNKKKLKQPPLPSPPAPAPQKKSVTKEHTHTERVQAVNKQSSDHDSEDNSSGSSSNSDSDSSSAGDETSSSDEEPDVVEKKAAAMAKSRQQCIPNNNKMKGKSPAPKASNMTNNLNANERQGLTNFGLAQVRDLLSSDDEDDDETAALPAAKADQALEGVKQQALSWLKMKTATKETKQEPGTLDTLSRRRKTGPSDDRSVVQQLPAKNKRRLSLDRGDQNANHLEDEEHKPFDTEELNKGDVPANFSEFGIWRDHLTASTKCYGIELGLPLEKVLKTFRINGETFVVAKWRNRVTPDAVKLKVLNALYPHLVIEYFENLEMRTVD
ncbi:DNA topoisomerase 1 isoform X1 [Drosophila albomicans]|uniref:DNA topoisomerase 1 isoform X1 n=1 Tax=Drosophila albomicans TaxID=7291 RepID=A0A6P8X4S6_DROAB|nr:DNA topoisomerase 1 isoform X1 [Drosophila albomicans]